MNTIKRTFRILAVVLSLGSLIGCNSSKAITFVEDPPFSIGDSYYQEWVAGVKDAGSGTNVHLSFSDIEKNITIQDVYFRRQKLKAQNFPLFRDQYVGYGKNFRSHIKEGEEVDITVDGETERRVSKVEDEIFPFALGEEEAVVSYLEYGVTRYYKVYLSERPTLAYPKKRTAANK